MAKATITDAESLLDTLEKCVKKGSQLSLGEVFDAIGHRSFGPLLLLAGLIMAAPGVGDVPGVPGVPGVPVLIGAFVFLVTIQIVIGHKHFWLPQVLLRRNVSSSSVCTAVRWLRTPARYLDSMSIKRLTWLTHDAGRYAIALTCTAIALTTPAMEIVLFTANIAGLAFVLFGLALVARDGLFALSGYALTAAAVGIILYYTF